MEFEFLKNELISFSLTTWKVFSSFFQLFSHKNFNYRISECYGLLNKLTFETRN
jgi:hypothetical protein